MDEKKPSEQTQTIDLNALLLEATETYFKGVSQAVQDLHTKTTDLYQRLKGQEAYHGETIRRWTWAIDSILSEQTNKLMAQYQDRVRGYLKAGEMQARRNNPEGQ